MSLAGLGVTAEQERVYRYFLRRPHADLATAAAELDIPGLSATVAELRTLGLISGSLVATKPAVAVDLLVRRRVEQTQRQLTELTTAWDVLTELAEEHRSGKAVHLVEHIPDGPGVTQRMNAVMAGAPEDFMYMKPLATYSSSPGPLHTLLAAGLRCRTLFSAQALRDPRQARHARLWHARGDLHRVTSEPVRHLAIVNRSVAFVQADPAGPEAGALQIRQPGLVAVLVDVYEGMWSRARDVDDRPLSPVEHQVLDALTRYDTDDAAARALNISVRKFRAHVADLMARLGARTRFQAALYARDRGWL
ncbi:hypothetical protein ACGF7U_28635 [Micromonospora sp. NPDC047670]|uniref:helix-turn-helix transcriptional regulator n=1 Tax=Micromonospora sp. NPDC047670 TaxID=3364252 RepID=UPI00371EDFA3